MDIKLGDDGTLDTVLYCADCGEEFRFNFKPSDEVTGDAVKAAYDAFIAQCIEDVEYEHECEPNANDDADEPSEEDITTSDHQHFYHCGKCIVSVDEDEDWMPAVGAWCKAHQYFPNVWWVSDHGNAHLISVSSDGRYLGGHSE